MSCNRATLATRFLDQAGWAQATRSRLAGDASSRQYERLTDGPNGKNSILMNAPGQTIEPFLNIAKHLIELDFSPPKIFHFDSENGFVLLEDLGDALFAHLAGSEPRLEQEIYEAAIDFLVELHRYPPPKICTTHSAETMANATALVFDFFAPNVSTAGKQAALREMTNALTSLHPFNPVLALRDFHSENLIWLPERVGSKRVGLLDFQDAIICHPAYDLISLIRDARRDIAPHLAKHLTDRYVDKTSQDKEGFLSAAAAFAVQRNLRILGIFSRLALRDGKSAYIDLIPRVWRHLLHDLKHTNLATLRDVLLEELPEPTPNFLTTLREKCRSNPIQF